MKTDGSVITWGFNGGDSSSVSTELTSGVVGVYSNALAFAALKSDGSVVTWGNQGNGGDSSSVSTDISSGVVDIFSSGDRYDAEAGDGSAFAALKSDGSVVTWGSQSGGGDSSSVSQDLSSDVDQIFSTSLGLSLIHI